MGVSVETSSRICANLELAFKFTNCSLSRKTSDGRSSKKAASGISSRWAILNSSNQVWVTNKWAALIT